MCNNTKLDRNLKTRLSGRELLRLHCRSMTHVHGGVDLTDGFVVCRELIDLDTVAHQLAHDLYFELVELALGDCVCFGNDGNDVDLQREQKACCPGLHAYTVLYQGQAFIVYVEFAIQWFVLGWYDKYLDDRTKSACQA